MTDTSPETPAEAPGVAFAFSGKSKCHSQMTDMTPETLAEAPGVAFAFSGKRKCHSQITDMSPETLAEAPRDHICFFRKKQMSLTDDRYESRNTSREAPGVTFAFFGKSKCHSHMTDLSQETQAEAP